MAQEFWAKAQTALRAFKWLETAQPPIAVALALHTVVAAALETEAAAAMAVLALFVLFGPERFAHSLQQIQEIFK